MRDFSIDGQDYQIGRLDAITQFNVARRLAPLVAGIAKAGQLPDLNPSDAGEFMSAIAEPLCRALASLSDDDTDYVIRHTLVAVTRKMATGFAPVLARNTSRLMYDDISMTTMLKLVFEVLKENLGDFFSFAPPESPSAPSPQS